MKHFILGCLSSSSKLFARSEERGPEFLEGRIDFDSTIYDGTQGGQRDSAYLAFSFEAKLVSLTKHARLYSTS